MTSRQAPPGQRPPPTRALSGSSQLQRQAQQRSHLQNQLGSSSPRNNVVDLTGDSNCPGSTRNAPAGRPSSALRLEAFREVKEKSAHRDAGSAPQTPVVSLPQQWLRGKPRWMSDFQLGDVRTTGQTSGFSSNAASPQKDAAILSMPTATSMPLPARPFRRQVRHDRKQLADAGALSKKDVTPKPFVMEVPADAPIARGNVRLDYFPWTGNHAEDKFSDSIIRNGYSDKTQENTNTAKQGIYPTLRNKSTLQMMNSLFSQMLNERRKLGIVDAPATFKPPPRVTLPDTKRESWLRDLANPSVPLRRLSRTIPHGIKNRVLLDQCALKEVPIERAIWLAKCVGANEIRASKRKGAPGTVSLGGEARWLKEWTSCVVQFLETAMAGSSDAARKEEGKKRMMYCLRLVDHLYAEGLLDEAQYLDMQLSSFEKSSEDKLPLRLLMLKSCKTTILKYRKTGRRYIISLCQHLQRIHESIEKDLHLQVVDKVANLLVEVLDPHPENFVSLKKWPQYSRTIYACAILPESELSDLLNGVSNRNKRLCTRAPQSNKPRHKVIQLLDTIYVTPFSAELGKECWKHFEDKTKLAQIVLDWATSIHRPGVVKVFTAARLLRIWSRHGLDVHAALIDWLMRTQDAQDVSSLSLYHLFSELARSGHFKISNYFLWLISRGGITSTKDVAADGSCSIRLLAELPIHDLSDSATTLRAALLRKATFSVDTEADAIEAAYSRIESCLPRLHGDSAKSIEHEHALDMLLELSGLSRTIKTEIGHLLRGQVRDCLAEYDAAGQRQDDPDAMDADTAECSLVADEFMCLRSILEQTGSVAMLADILKLIVSHNSSNSDMLALCADTMSANRDSLAAIGALQNLFDLIVMRYRSLSVVQDPEPNPMLHSLYQLASRVQATDILRQLKQDVIRSNQKAAVDACSPVSDHVGEVLSNPKTDFYEEIEKMLYSGSSMDSAAFSRLFDALTEKFESLWMKGSEDLQQYCSLLARLRAFDELRFNSMITAWITTLVDKPQRPRMEPALQPLVVAGCVSFLDALKSCSQRTNDVTAQNSIVNFATNLEILDIALGLSAAKDILPTKDSYTINIKRLECQGNIDYYTIVLDTVKRYILDAAEAEQARYLDIFMDLCQQEMFIRALQRIVLTQSDAFNEHIMVLLSRTKNENVMHCLRFLMRGLLHLPICPPSGLRSGDRIGAVLDVASDLSLPYSQMALRAVLGNENICAEHSADNGSSDEFRPPLEAFERAIDQALAAGNMTWASIIPKLDESIAQHLSERAERIFLEKLGDFSLHRPQAEDNLKVARCMRSIMNVTGYSMRGKRPQSTGLSLVEKTKTIVHLFQQDGDIRSRWKVAEPWIPLALSFAIHLASTSETSEATEDMKAKLVVAISTLHLVVRAKNLGDKDIHDIIFDTILYLVDELSDATLERISNYFERPVVLADRANVLSSTAPSTSSTPSESQNATSAPLPLQQAAPASIFAPLPASLTAAADPALKYALSLGFGKDEDDELVLVQKLKPPLPQQGQQQSQPMVPPIVTPFHVKKWENLTDPTPNVGENDASLNLRLFEARKE